MLRLPPSLFIILYLLKGTSCQLSSSMSDLEETLPVSGTVSITQHPDLGLKTSILDPKTAFSISQTQAPQIRIDEIEPTTTEESLIGKVSLTEFKFLHDTIKTMESEEESITQKDHSSSVEPMSGETDGPTIVVKSKTDENGHSSIVIGLNYDNSVVSSTEKILDKPVVIDQSSNELESQVSTGQQVEPSGLAASTSSSLEEECNPKVNPNCMPFTTSRSISLPNDNAQEETTQPGEDPTTTIQSSSEESIVTETSGNIEDVTSSLFEEPPSDAFCSETDAECLTKPTAAMLTQTEPIQTIDPSADHFLVVKASQNSHKIVRPNKNRTDTQEHISGNNTDENTIATGDTRKKSERRADNNGGLPDVNDIISGLLNVVGEGLTIATNFVKEEHKRKKGVLASQETTTPKEELLNFPPMDDRSKPSRINNRGPPRLSEIPFENIPLEVLSSVQPGQQSFQVQQLPFHSRLKVTKTKRKPFFPPYAATGIPLPENLLPESDLEITSTPVLKTTPHPASDVVERVWISDHAEPDKETGSTEPTELDVVSLNQTASTDHKTSYFPTNNEPLGHVYFPDDNFNQNTVRPRPITTHKQPLSELTTTTATTTTTTTTTTTITTAETTTTTTEPSTETRPQPFIGPVRPLRPTTRPPPLPTTRPIIESNDIPVFDQQPVLPSATRTPPLFATGQVLNDTPHQLVTATIHRPPSRHPDIFDVTVTAHQNYGQGNNVDDIVHGKPQNPNSVIPDILTEALPGDQFVSIDGKKTYFDIGPSVANQDIVGNVGSSPGGLSNGGQYLGSAQPVRPEELSDNKQPDYYEPQPILNRPTPPSLTGESNRGPTAKPDQPPPRLPVAPPVRIDTCIVGDDTTCTKEKNEFCKTSLGISSCFCRPGYGRKDEGKSCQKVVQLLMSMQVDRINQVRLQWNSNYLNPNSREYRFLSDEASHAISSAMSLTSLNGLYVSNEINRFFPMNSKVTVNATLVLIDNSHTRSLVVKRDIQKKLIEVIQARNNNIGNGRLFVDGPLNPIPGVADLNECAEPEMNDCSESAKCINQFGGFTCKCQSGYGDRFSDDDDKSGRYCESCSADHCNGRGTCKIDQAKEKVCECKGNYYGRQCELDGEVVAVAIGASVAAVIIIILTLTCLCMWSRRWKRDHQKTEIMRGFPPYIIPGAGANYSTPASAVAAANYMANLNKAAAMSAHHQQQQRPIGPPPQAVIQQGTPTTAAEKRSRWLADNYGQNIYAQVHSGTPAQFQPGAGGNSLYSEPVYSHPPPNARAVLTLAPPYSPPPPIPTVPYTRQSDTQSMYGTLPRNFYYPDMNQQAARRRRLMDVRNLHQYATFRLSAAEVGLIMPRQMEEGGSNQDLMLDEETLRATRFNSTRLSLGDIEDKDNCTDDYQSTSSEDKSQSFAMVQRPPPPPPRKKNIPEASTLSPSSNHSEKVRSLPSANVYKPLPPLPPSESDILTMNDDDESSEDSSETSGQASPTTSSSTKKLSVTFCDNEVVTVGNGPKSKNLFKSLFHKNNATTKSGSLPGNSKLRNSPERSTTVTPTPILIPRPMTNNNEKRHLPLTKRLSNKLREPFAQNNF